MSKVFPEENISNLCDVRDGTHDSPKYQKSGIPLLTQKNIRDKKLVFDDVSYVSVEDAVKINARSRVNEGDILMSMIGTIGEPAMVNNQKEFCIKNIALFKPNHNKVSNHFLFQYFSSDLFKTYVEGLIDGGVQKFLGLTTLRGLNVPYPEIIEQKKIAEILTSVDRVIELTSQEIDKLKDLKKGMMQELLTKGIGHTKFKDSPVGKIPESWECSVLGDYVHFKGGYAFKSEDFTPDGIQLIRMGNLYQNQLDLTRAPVYISDSLVKQYEDFVLSGGDIVLSMTGTFGKRDYGFAVQIPDTKNKKFFLNQRVGKFIVKDEKKTHNSFLLYLLQSEVFLNKLYTVAGGTKQANLSSNHIIEIEVAWPLILEQVLITKTLNCLEQQIDTLATKHQKLLNTKKGLMNDLLTGKVRVKV